MDQNWRCVEKLRRQNKCILCDLVLRRIPRGAKCLDPMNKILHCSSCIHFFLEVKDFGLDNQPARFLHERDDIYSVTIQYHHIGKGRDLDFNSQTGNVIDFDWITQWLHKSRHEDFCAKASFPHKRYQSPASILLIDVQNRCLVKGLTTWKYAALSYVWGKARFLVNQTSLDAALRQKNALSSKSYGKKLPRTIKDAIKLVSEVGERYLWVDSLCVVQDSKRKHDTLALMDVIYSCAKFTIVALDGRGANSPLPGVRPTTRRRLSPSCQIKDINFISVPPTLTQLNKTAIHPTRGWTFQEILLSRKWIYLSEQVTHVRCVCDGIDDDLTLSKNLNDLRLLLPPNQANTAHETHWKSTLR